MLFILIFKDYIWLNKSKTFQILSSLICLLAIIQYTDIIYLTPLPQLSDFTQWWLMGWHGNLLLGMAYL